MIERFFRHNGLRPFCQKVQDCREHHEKPAEVSAHRGRTDPERGAGRSIDSAGGRHDPRAQPARPSAPFRGARGGGAARQRASPAPGPGTAVWYHENEAVEGRILKAPWVYYTVNFHAARLPPPPFEQRVWRPGAAVGDRFQSLLDAWRDRGCRHSATHAGLRPVVGPPAGSDARTESGPSHRRRHASLVGHRGEAPRRPEPADRLAVSPIAEPAAAGIHYPRATWRSACRR